MVHRYPQIYGACIRGEYFNVSEIIMFFEKIPFFTV